MGKVILIGAGPGDPQLLTLKAAGAIAAADVVLIDELVHRDCLSHARRDVQVVEVGKRGGCKSTPQAFIEKLLIRYACEDKCVVRLKGGDAFVFGRGGEEVETLLEAGIEVEVIPGVTAGIAVPASLGIPVTHRGLARGVSFVTGHSSDGSELDWVSLARSGTTLVIYMGLSNIARIRTALLAAGMDPATPSCLIQNGTLRNQKERVATLATLSGDGFDGPALVVIGEVVRFARTAAGNLNVEAA